MSEPSLQPVLGSDLHHRSTTGKIYPAKVVALHADGSLDLVVFGHTFPFSGLVERVVERHHQDDGGWFWPGATLVEPAATVAATEEPAPVATAGQPDAQGDSQQQESTHA